jgi:hypothetical protein
MASDHLEAESRASAAFKSPADESKSSRPEAHLFGPGPKRMLTLNGGGVRGIVAIAFLERLERLIEEVEGRPVLLGDWFDYVGGVSTGAIIAGAIALGYRAADIYQLYQDLRHRLARHFPLRLVGRQSIMDTRKMTKELAAIFGSRTLDSDDLHTGFCAICKRMDTGSTWLISNNPRGHFWNDPPDGSFIGNRHFALANVIRASTAAPLYYDPELFPITQGQAPGVFIDGGVSPHNNPALYMFLSVALPQFAISWPLGADNLTIVSVGTGSYRYAVTMQDLPWVRSAGVALHALLGQIGDAEQLVLALMSWLGECPMRWWINREFGDLSDATPPGGSALFRFLRYDIHLEQDWLEAELGSTLDQAAVLSLRQLAAVENMPLLYELGRKAAEKQLRAEHLYRPLTKNGPGLTG